MKKSIQILIFLCVVSTAKSNAQVYSAYYSNYMGTGTILYPNYGVYYGSILNGFAHGIGTAYFIDGSFYYGNFHMGWWDGPGVIVSRQQGFVAGCFMQGRFVGACEGVYNPYEHINEVETIVTDVQTDMPDNDIVESFDFDDYTIEKIDGSTEMGGVILGKYTSK